MNIVTRILCSIGVVLLAATSVVGAERRQFPGGIYADATPAGSCQVTIHDREVRSCDGGHQPLPAGDVMFMVMAPDGRAAGLGHDNGHIYELVQGRWEDRGIGFGNNPVIYDLAGNLVVVRGPGEFTGSIGWRYAGPDRLVASWETYDPSTPLSQQYGITRLYEWTRQGDITCGQGDTGGLVCLVAGKRVLVEGGDIRFVRFHLAGTQLSLAAANLQGGYAVVHFMSVSELAGLPGVPDVPVDPPVDPPVPPVEPPVTQGPPLPDAIFKALQAARLHYPTPLGNQGAALINEVAANFAGWGLESKSGGNTCPQPVTIKAVSCDIIRGPGNWGYDVLGDSENAGIVVKGTPGAADPARFVEPVGGVPPVDPPPTDDVPALKRRIALLEAQVVQLNAELTETKAALVEEQNAVDDLERQLQAANLEIARLKAQQPTCKVNGPGWVVNLFNITCTVQ